jgi:hypothetical protein
MKALDKFFFKIFWISKNFKYHNFLIMNVFHMWMVGYHNFKKNLIKTYLLKESLA